MTRRALPILILAILALSMIPVLPLNAISFITVNPVVPSSEIWGETVKVFVEDVTAGYDVELYWDKVKAWDGEAGMLNTTEADAAGTAEIWFDVPEAVGGEHWLWVVDTKTAETDKESFTVETDVDVSPSSGLEGDKVTVKGYGFGEERDVAILLRAASIPNGVDSDAQSIGVADGVETEFSDTLDNVPVVPTSVTVTASGKAALTDPLGDGKLTGADGEGTINYVTGAVEVTYDTAVAGYGTIQCTYDYYLDYLDEVYIFSLAVDTNGVGSYVKSVTVPDEATEMGYGSYSVYSYDAVGWEDTAVFAIGSVITLDVEDGPTGTVVEVKGRGFEPGRYVGDVAGEVVITDGTTPIECTIVDMATGGEEVDTYGKFKFDIVIPTVPDLEDYDTIVVTDGLWTADADFEVLGDAEIEVDPEFGLQGEKISIEGFNFTALSGEEVIVNIDTTYVDTFKTDSDGEFSDTFNVPAKTSGAYELTAEQADYNIKATKKFRIGLMIVIVSPDEGPSGKKVTLTGTGFSEGETWNATLNGITLFEEEYVNSEGELEVAGEIPTFYVPTVDVGTYEIEVLDIDTEIEVTAEFEVTATTLVEADPVMAPNEYNVTLEGWYFAAILDGDLDFVLWNATDDWDMDVLQGKAPGTDAMTDKGGNFTAWWEVPDDETLSLGEYTINATGEEDLFAQLTFEIVSKKVEISPRKSEFAITESVSFIIESSFAQEDSYIKIWDPDDNLVWRTDDFIEDYWLKVGVLETLPYYRQTAGGNPMTLLEDAPLGTWSYTWYDEDDDELDTGTFTVVAAPARVLEERIGGLEDLVSGISDDVSGLSDVISGVQSDLSDVKTDLADAKAAVDAAKAAADDAAAAVSEVAAVAERAADSADAAKDSAGRAAEAVDEIQKNVGGLSTLVYGAIGASLVAALAAIVSLMQISRRIAG